MVSGMGTVHKTNEHIKEKEKSLISHQTREDVISLLVGFDELCHEKLKISTASIKPSRINSDIIENVFSQQRGLHNEANTNPTYLAYSRTMNSVVLGQSSVSRKSNTGCSGADFSRVQKENSNSKTETMYVC